MAVPSVQARPQKRMPKRRKRLILWSTSCHITPSATCVLQVSQVASILSKMKLTLPAAWMIFWNASALKSANVFVLINSFTQLYYIFGRLPPMNTKSTSSVLTHIVSKTFAGIGVLDLLHNGSVAYFDHQGPSTAVKVLTGIGFGALAGASDWILGGCLVYDLVGLAVGQRQYGETNWSNLLGVYAVGTATIVGLRNWVR